MKNAILFQYIDHLGNTEPDLKVLEGETEVYIRDKDGGILEAILPPSTSQSYPVSPSFRSWFISSFGLSIFALDRKDKMLLRLAAFLLPGAHINYSSDDDGDGILILFSSAFAASVVLPGSRSHQLNIGNLLDEFQQRFWKLEIEEANRYSGLARRIVKQHLPLLLRRKLDAELLQVEPVKLVDLVSGDPWVPNEPVALLPSHILPVERIRRQLNSLPASFFDPVISEIPEAVCRVKGRKDWNVEQQRHQLGMLRKVAASAKPYYQAVTRTNRLYPLGASWLGLARDIRDHLTRGFWKFDLSSAHIRIASALWKFKLYEDPSDHSVWTKLLRDCGSRPNNLALKSDLKNFIYPALFGQTVVNLKKRARKMGQPGLLQMPQIAEILTARKLVMAKIASGQVMTDAWGSKHQVRAVKGKRSDSEARSIMAAICQSYELRILMPVFEYAEANGLTIAALLHDGIYCLGDWAPHVSAVKKLVDDESMKLLGSKVPLDAKAPEVVVEVLKTAA